MLPGSRENLSQLDADAFFLVKFLGNALQKRAPHGRLALAQKAQAGFNQAFLALQACLGLLPGRAVILLMQYPAQTFEHCAQSTFLARTVEDGLDIAALTRVQERAHRGMPHQVVQKFVDPFVQSGSGRARQPQFPVTAQARSWPQGARSISLRRK